MAKLLCASSSVVCPYDIYIYIEIFRNDFPSPIHVPIPGPSSCGIGIIALLLCMPHIAGPQGSVTTSLSSHSWAQYVLRMDRAIDVSAQGALDPKPTPIPRSYWLGLEATCDHFAAPLVEAGGRIIQVDTQIGAPETLSHCSRSWKRPALATKQICTELHTWLSVDNKEQSTLSRNTSMAMAHKALP